MLLKIISIISIPEAFIQKRVMELSWQKGFVHLDMLKGLEIRNNSHISSSWVKILIYRKYFKNRSFEEIFLYGLGFSFLEALELTSPAKSLQIQSQWFVCPHSHFSKRSNFQARSMFCSGHNHAVFLGISSGSSGSFTGQICPDGESFAFPEWCSGDGWAWQQNPALLVFTPWKHSRSRQLYDRLSCYF